MFFSKTHDDVVLFTVFFQVASSKTIYTVTHVHRNGRSAKSVTCKFFFIKDNLKFGTVFFTVDIDITSTRDFFEFIFEFFCQKVSFVEVVAIDFNSNIVTTSTTATTRSRYCIVNNFRGFVQYATNRFGNLPNSAFTFPFFRATYGHRNFVVSRRREQCADTTIVIGTYRSRDQEDFRSNSTYFIFKQTSHFH